MGNKFCNSTSLDLCEILAHVQQLLPKVGFLSLFKYRLFSSFISQLFSHRNQQWKSFSVSYKYESVS